MSKHDIYRPILHHDMKIRTLAPPEIRSYIEENESFSRSGDSFRGEGGDYIIETENKHLKSNLPPGVPKFSSWVMASRIHEKMQANRNAVFEKACFKDPGKQQSSIFNFDLEVQMVRKLIRRSEILFNPRDLVSLLSLDGTPLHPSLVNFCITASENYQAYLSQ